MQTCILHYGKLCIETLESHLEGILLFYHSKIKLSIECNIESFFFGESPR